MFNLETKTAFITAGAQGIGRSIAIELARAGADIVVAQRDIKKVDGVIDEIKSMGRQAIGVHVDVTDMTSVKNGVQKALEQFPRIDILVNNAGCGEHIAGSTTLDDFDACNDVNVKGVWRVCSELAPHFKANQSGKIINISSVAGRRGNTDDLAYRASKAAVINLTQSLACQLGPDNINVNVICPTGIPTTELVQKALSQRGLTKEGAEKHLMELGVLKRLVTTDDIAYATVFFASPAAKSITGQTLNVDAGFIMS
mgnify:CR=1 FL=1